MQTSPEIAARRPNPTSDNQAAVGAGSYTIAEWCKLHRLSLSMFYKMQVEGWGPRTMVVGACTRISAEADANWTREREAAAAAGVRRALPRLD
jgi:hypothetical protein